MCILKTWTTNNRRRCTWERGSQLSFVPSKMTTIRAASGKFKLTPFRKYRAFWPKSTLNLRKRIIFHGFILTRKHTPSPHWFCTGLFFYWSALKMTKFHTLRKFWHFSDGTYYVIWHLVIFKGGPVKKHPVCSSGFMQLFWSVLPLRPDAIRIIIFDSFRV